MSDTAELWRAVKKQSQADRENRRANALTDFTLAHEAASHAGLVLLQRTDAHYQLSNGKWLINLYPGNQRLYWDRNKAKPPYLKVPEPWTLIDCVNAAIEAMKQKVGVTNV